MSTETSIAIKLHNPIVLPGLDVVSQTLEDEKLGKPIDDATSRYLISAGSEESIVAIVNKNGEVIASTDLLTFTLNGVIGRSRFTVMIPKETNNE